MRVGVGKRVGRGFVFLTFGVIGFWYALLCIIGILGIASIIYASH